MTVSQLWIVPSSDDVEDWHAPNQDKLPNNIEVHPLAGAHRTANDVESDNMIASSSPVLYPPSSSPVPVPQKKKRKLFQSFPAPEIAKKKPKLVGGFEVDDEEPEHQMLNDIFVNEGIVDSDDVQTKRYMSDPVSDARTSSVASTSLDGTKAASLLALPALVSTRLTAKTVKLQTSTGKTINIATRTRDVQVSYEQTIAQRSITEAGRAKTAYYGIEIHKLIDEAKIQRQLDEAAAEFRQQQQAQPPIADSKPEPKNYPKPNSSYQLWTEKYRAKKFTDLVGDERTHRSVLRWLKHWDDVVFPGNAKLKPKKIYEDFDPEKQHRKILLLTGPPGLGKTTLAHVCAKQAGYEVLEINASDDRSKDVVKGRIKDALATETVRGIQEQGKARKAGRPVCVVVDEVDGVVAGSGGSGGEGGFMRALIDLIHMDKRNSSETSQAKTTKKGDRFRLMRPLIMICNDVYAPALRPLRQSGLAEIIHVRKPALDKVILRLRRVFEKENIACDNDAIRRLCESSWGLGTRKQNSLGGRGSGEGDIRSVLVQGEWAAHKLRAATTPAMRLTRKWVEEHLGVLSASQKGLGRGGVREMVERIFLEGAGLPNLPTALTREDERLIAESKTKPTGVADLRKRTAITALREMMDTCGEHDRVVTECFSTYPTQAFQDDTVLSKPNSSYEWLHFHDCVSSRIFSGQEWELNAYLSTSACGFHNLYAALDKGSSGWNEEKPQDEESEVDAHPFAGLKADFAAHEAEKANRNVISEMRSKFSAPLLRLFSSVDAIATELIPNVAKMLAPDVKPIVVGGSNGSTSMASVRKENEKQCVQTAVKVMHGLGIDFEKVRVEHEGGGAHSNGGYALRMEPPLDVLTSYHITKPSSSTKTTVPTTTAPVRYAIRQVLAQELIKEKSLQAAIARQARGSAPFAAQTANDTHKDANKENEPSSDSGLKSKSLAALAATATNAVKRDFFGRPIASVPMPKHSRKPSNVTASSSSVTTKGTGDSSGQRTWVSFHEGYSNAVRKYISMSEFLDAF